MSSSPSEVAAGASSEPSGDDSAAAPLRSKVLHLSTNADRGGAARAMLRLHLSLLEAGEDSAAMVLRSEQRWPRTRQFAPRRSLMTRLKSRLPGRWPGAIVRPPSARHDAFSDCRVVHGGQLMRALPAAEIMHLHWITGFVDWAEFFRRRDGPLVWTVHDMNPFTGGCHYTEGCARFTSTCGSCPQLESTEPRDLSTTIQKRKADALRSIGDSRLRLVAPNTWMRDQISRSALLGRFRVEVIPYGIDLERYRPLPQAEARHALQISPRARVLFFCADYQTPRKGFRELMTAIERLADVPDLCLLSVGAGAPDLSLPVPHVRLGHVTDDDTIIRAYSAADLFVIPSLEDNLPNTILEALACGVPVIGFAAGGIAEGIGEAGAAVPVGDTTALATALRGHLLDDEMRQQLALAARRRAEREYGSRRQASAYAKLYREILATPAT